jgi:hypothetical protein
LLASDLINSALRLIGIIRTGQTAAATETAEGLAALNLMLDSWSTERLDVLYAGLATYSLVSGTQTYTMGPSGSLGSVRPNRIEAATCNIANPGGAGVQEYNLILATREQWTAIREKGTASNVAQVLYYDRAFPLGNIRLWPVPNTTGITLTLHTWSVLASFPDLVTDVALAPGYGRAIEFTLAVELAGRFGVAVPDVVMRNAAAAMNAIRSLNAEVEEPAPNTPDATGAAQ